MRHGPRDTLARAPAQLVGLVGAAMLLSGIVTAIVPSHATAQTEGPAIWTKVYDMGRAGLPCKSDDQCTRQGRVPGIAIVGTGFGPYETILVRLVSLDGSRESFTITTEAYTAEGRFTVLTGERVCTDFSGPPESPLESSGLPDEHAWEVRAELLTSKSGVAISSNILYLYSCGDGPVG
jgi:hypothetical protein